MALAKQRKKKDAPDLSAITQALEEDIALGRLLPRERLIEEDLAVRFDVNRHVIRQVLTDLEAIGVIVRQKNKGATVRDVTPREVENIYAVRELLEGKAAELIALPPAPDLLGLLKDIQLRHAEAAQAGKLTDVFRLNLRFHRVFFSACGNSELVEAIQQFALKAHIARSVTIRIPRLLERAVSEHAQMLELMEAADREALVKLVIQHIIPSRDAYLESYRSRFGDEANEH